MFEEIEKPPRLEGAEIGAEAAAADAPVPALAIDAKRLERACASKERGNLLIKDRQFGAAQGAYREALQEMAGVQSTDTKLLKARSGVRLSCLLNLSLCDLKVEEFHQAAKHATDALELDPGNCKALFRRGMARLSCGDAVGCQADLREALRIEPRNAEIRALLQECRDKLVESEEWSKSAFGGMFGKAPVRRTPHRSLANLPMVWLDFQIGDNQPHRVRFALYADTVPRTAENFRSLCTGERGMGRCGQPLHFKNTLVHRVVRRSLIEAGDIENYDGTGGESIYGCRFPDEGFVDTHHSRGLLSMANRGPNTNGSKFFVTLRSLPQFDQKNVVFGEVVGEAVILEQIEALETNYRDAPVTQVAIIDSGQEHC